MRFPTISLLLAAISSRVLAQDTLPPPTKFAIALFPGFQAIDAFGPLDVLNILSWRTYLNLTVLSSTLDPVSTDSGVFPHNRSSSTFKEFIQPTHTFDTAPADIEVLIVPGGLGNRLPPAVPVVDYIRKVYPSLRYLITVCTGSGLAARAGVLDGKKATTNKWAFGETSKLGPKTHWIAHARWIVDGNIWTSSGVSAGIDVMLAWVQSQWGYATAKELADGAEYEWHQDASWDPFSLKWNVSDVINGTTMAPSPFPTSTPVTLPASCSTQAVTTTIITTQTVVVTSVVTTTSAKPITTTKSVKTTKGKTTTRKKVVTMRRHGGYDAR